MYNSKDIEQELVMKLKNIMCLVNSRALTLKRPEATHFPAEKYNLTIVDPNYLVVCDLRRSVTV